MRPLVPKIRMGAPGSSMGQRTGPPKVEARRCRERKIQARQLQQARLAVQAVIAPLMALTRRAQAKPDLLANVNDSELAKLSMSAARALPRLHAHELLMIGNPEEKLSELEQADSPQQIRIEGLQFRWVQTRCQCGHPWDCHDQTDENPAKMPCGMRECDCQKFIDTGQVVPEPPPSLEEKS
jgi:hypothetical protein